MPNEDWDGDAEDQDLDSTEDENDTEDTSDTDGDGDTSDTGDAGAAKRIKDLQSKADKEQARANKLQSQLDALNAQKKSPTDDGKRSSGAVPPELRQWLDAAKDQARTRFYESEPRFKEYGIDPGLIQGDTPEEMQASVTRLRKQVAKIETQIRQKVLTEHGYVEEPKGGTPTPKRDWASMSSEDFDKEVRRLGY